MLSWNQDGGVGKWATTSARMVTFIMTSSSHPLPRRPGNDFISRFGLKSLDKARQGIGDSCVAPADDSSGIEYERCWMRILYY